MNISSFSMAEGSVEDASGRISLIGVNANVFAPESLPAITKRSFLLYAVDHEGVLNAGAQVEINLNLSSPSGKVLTAGGAIATVGERRWSQVPGSLHFLADLVISASEYGVYQVVCTMKPEDQPELVAETVLYVVPPAETASSPEAALQAINE